MKILTIIAILALMLTGCATGDDAIQIEESIKVGVLGPLTGPVSNMGEYMERGISIAMEDIENQGGIGGRRIELIYEDTKCVDLAGTQTALNKLKELDQVTAIIGPFCGSTNRIAGEFSTSTGMFMISPGDNLGNIGKYKVNTRYLIEEEAKKLAEYAAAQGYKRVGLLYNLNDWGVEYKRTLEWYLPELGSELTISEGYDYGNLDVRTQLLKIDNIGVDALVIIDSTTGTLFAQPKELGLDIPLLSEWQIETGAAKLGSRDSLEGVVISSPAFEETMFHKKFEEKYGYQPNDISADSYNAMILIADAMRACPEYDSECMLEFVTSLENYPGASGPLTFNKEKWAFEKEFVYKKYQNGEFVPIDSHSNLEILQ